MSAATLAVRQHLMITRELELPIDRVVFWTDSTSVLKFIRNTDRRFQTFVANRIAQIHDGSEISSWKYVPSELNPADDASRGLSTSDLSRGCRWSMGPGFLRKPDDWPVQPDNAGILPDDHPEVRLIKSGHASVTVTSELSFIDQLITRFSTWHKLKKCLSWILRYRSNLLAASRDRKSGAPWNHVRHDILAVTVDEMRHAESEIIMHVQKQSYPDEMNSLVQDGRPIKKSSSICKLNPIMMEGILRVGGRLARSSLDVDSKHQIIIPKNHRVSALIINHYHTLSGHSGREYVLALLRRRYWITHGNSAVRTVLTRCVECKKIQGRVGTQKMADLPADRLTPDKPVFTYVGIDFFGPYMVKRGRAQVKRYALIFTCLAIRAVHIEITHSLDTDSFLQAISRFIARRGKPDLIRSDNGGSFIRGEREIRDGIAAWNQDKISDYLVQKTIEWIFNPPLASHYGGTWERCI